MNHIPAPTAAVRAAVALLLAFSATPAVALASPLPPAEEPSRPAWDSGPAAAPERVLVRFKPQMPGWRAETQAALAGARVNGRMRGLAKLGWTVLEPVTGESAADVLRRVAASGTAAAVEFDGVARRAVTPDDSMYSLLWGMNNTGQTILGVAGTPGADIGAERAWDTTIGSASTIVAVVDTGVDFSHPDLAGNAWVNPGEIAGNGVDDDGNGYVDDVNGWDFANGDGTVFDPDEMDPQHPEEYNDTHGTHVAGTIGAVGNNDYGVTGVNWDVQIMSLKFIGSTSGSVADGAEAIVYATDHGATAINHSWTVGATYQVLDDALAYSGGYGVLNVCAAGNNGSLDNDEYPLYPASAVATNVVAVAATDNTDELAAFSHYGATRVDLAAPGVDILSTIPDASYAYFNGTSMATPHVTGALALLHSAYPDETSEDLRRRIESTVDVLPSLAGKVATEGRLNLAAAIAGARVVSPSAGDHLMRNAEATVTFEPVVGTDPAATFDVQVGLPIADLANGGFEAGSLTGWTPGGDSPARYVSSAAGDVHSGTYGARSGDLDNSEDSWISRSVTLPADGELSFWYWLDSEDWWDFGYVVVDGSPVWKTVEDASWTRVRLPLEAGTHTVTIGYYKDNLYSDGLDAFGIDDVTVTAYTWSDASVVDGSYEATFTVPDVDTDDFAVRARSSEAGDVSPWHTVTGITLDPDTAAPAAPTELSAERSGAQDIALAWTNPRDHDFDVTRVVRRIDTLPTGPDDSSAEVVYEGSGEAVVDLGAYVSAEGEMHYAAYAYDTSGNASDATRASIVLDVDGPYGTFRLDGGAAYATTVTVSADSAMSDVAQMAFDVPGFAAGDWESYAAQRTLTLAGEGAHTVTAHYRDEALNEATLTDSIVVDWTPPAVDVAGLPAPGVWSTSPVSATLGATDAGSGVAAITYRLDGGAPVTYSAPVAMPEGEHSLEYRARDNAGNESDPVSVTVRVDTVAPAAPAGLAAQATGMGWARLSWDAVAASDVASYSLYRSLPAGGTRTLIATVPAEDPLEWLDTGLTDDAQYGYVVTATDEHGLTSPYSAQALVAPGVDLAPAAGANRYETAMIAALDGFDSAPVVVLATGADYADALGASALAGAYDAPVLLTKRDSLPSGLLGTLGILDTNRVIIVGGTAAVSAAVETALNAEFGAANVDRIAGSDRYDTAARVAAATLAARGPATDDRVFVVRGNDFADALAVAPVAYGSRMPILLVKPTSAPAATVNAVAAGGYAGAVVVGGEAAVPSAVASGLGVAFERVAGSTRYDTARQFAYWAEDESLATFGTVGLATGEDFPDALGGGAVVGHESGVLLLTKGAALSSAASDAIETHAMLISRLRIFGGDAAISPAARTAAQALVGR